jgi:Transaldolase/Fructose-6-phosphate aldolase
MIAPNLGRVMPLRGPVHATIGSLLKKASGSSGAAMVRGDEEHVCRVSDFSLDFSLFKELSQNCRHIGVTPNFREVISTFKTPPGETPAGFRIEFAMEQDGVLRMDLVRDISYDRNGQRRPTPFLFSADSADPYEVAPIAELIANLTCNPGIIYDLFINNPKANVGKKFKTRDEVMQEIGRILGPGCDISVELNNPFEEDEQKILDEAEKFREMLSPYRVVIKVPHTGPVNAHNVHELLDGDKKFHRRYDQGATKDMLRGHHLALLLRDHGFKVNFTLMFEPYQTALALQAKPYFINSFIRHRESQTAAMKQYLDQYRRTEDASHLADLRNFLIEKDYLAADDKNFDPMEAKCFGERTLEYRKAACPGRTDGLDAVRHNLRLIRALNLTDTRLIICSMEGDYNYLDIDNLLADPQIADVLDRLVITAVPAYLARYTSSNLVVSYQRRFMNAAKGAN